MGILIRIAYLLPETTRLNLCYVFCYPYPTYCNTVWTVVWPKKLNVGNAWLHKAAFVTRKKISLCANLFARLDYT